MVESFSNNNKDSSFIKGAKVMENFSDNNENGSSIFQGKIREQDLSAEQKLNELKAAMEELARQDSLKRLECERQASSCIDEISSQAELHTEGDDEGEFTCERALGDFWNFFESLFNLFEVNVDDPKIYQMLKEKKEKNWLLSIIKFLRDKLKELIKKIFARDLSFDQRLDKEIKELQEKLNSGELSEEEFARALERLEALQNLKLKLQMAVTGWIITMFAEMFGVELAAIVEASKEETNKAEDKKAEDKKAEKTSLKEENKEVCENVEIKVDAREKPAVPVSLFEVSPGFVRPGVLNKPEFDLLSNSLKELMPKEVIKEEIREVKETKPKVEEKKQEEPKKEVCPPKPAEQKPEKKAAEVSQKRYAEDNNLDSRRQKRDSGSSTPRRRSAKGSSFDTGNFPKVDHFQVPSGTTDNEKSNADQISSASSVQEDPRSKVTDVLNERAARGNGNAPSRS